MKLPRLPRLPRLPWFKTPPKELLHILIHGSGRSSPTAGAGRVLRWARIGVLILVAVVTLQSALLVAGAFRNDIAIESDMGVAEAEVLSAGPRRSAIEFVTPERITYRPELGVLYPSELSTGMQIYVEYDRQNPDWRIPGRVQTEIARMPLAMKLHIALHPAHIRGLSARTVMTQA